MRIELERVGKRFGRQQVLRDVTLDLPSGARVALVGPNGSGKSTLLKVLMGLLGYDGSVRIGGLDRRTDGAAIAPRLAYVPQVAPLAAASVGELVTAIADVRAVSAERVAANAAALELDLVPVRSKPFRALSGGMRQKVLLALALAIDASLYILDEPTASLDARGRAAFLGLYQALAPAATLVLCSHRLEEIRHLVDHVVLLEEGRVAFRGTADAFLAGRAASVVELLVEGGAGEPWLRDRGFTAGAGGWWARLATPAEKIQLLPAASRALGGALRDVVVRDVESLDPRGPHA